jgi:hypothetical protein
MKWGVPQHCQVPGRGQLPWQGSLGVIALRLGTAGIPTTGSYTSAAGYDVFKEQMPQLLFLGAGMYGWRLRFWGLNCGQMGFEKLQLELIECLRLILK